jgi:hypothetical protein
MLEWKEVAKFYIPVHPEGLYFWFGDEALEEIVNDEEFKPCPQSIKDLHMEYFTKDSEWYWFLGHLKVTDGTGYFVTLAIHLRIWEFKDDSKL